MKLLKLKNDEILYNKELNLDTSNGDDNDGDNNCRYFNRPPTPYLEDQLNNNNINSLADDITHNDMGTHTSNV